MQKHTEYLRGCEMYRAATTNDAIGVVIVRAIECLPRDGDMQTNIVGLTKSRSCTQNGEYD